LTLYFFHLFILCFCFFQSRDWIKDGYNFIHFAGDGGGGAGKGYPATIFILFSCIINIIALY
jgi:hypothetical protein